MKIMMKIILIKRIAYNDDYTCETIFISADESNKDYIDNDNNKKNNNNESYSNCIKINELKSIK